MRCWLGSAARAALSWRSKHLRLPWRRACPEGSFWLVPKPHLPSPADQTWKPLPRPPRRGSAVAEGLDEPGERSFKRRWTGFAAEAAAVSQLSALQGLPPEPRQATKESLRPRMCSKCLGHQAPEAAQTSRKSRSTPMCHSKRSELKPK